MADLFFGRTLSQLSSFVLIVVLGFSSLHYGSFNGIGSDEPHQLAIFFVLMLLLRIYHQPLNETNPWKWGLLAGVSIAAAYLIRPVRFSFAMRCVHLNFSKIAGRPRFSLQF